MTGQFCTFAVGELLFGVDVRQVQEVIRFQELTRVPLAAADVGGLINLRGQIVTAIDLRQRLRLPPGQGRPMNVVIHTDDGAVSLQVDEIGDVLDLGPDTFEPMPATLTGPARTLAGGVHKLDGRLLLLLDTARAVAGGDSPVIEAA